MDEILPVLFFLSVTSVPVFDWGGSEFSFSKNNDATQNEIIKQVESSNSYR